MGLLFRCSVVLSLTLAVACSGEEPFDGYEDDEQEGVVSIGKQDGFSVTPCVGQAMLALLNKEDTDYAALRAVQVSKRATENILAHRDGPDGVLGTDDDDLFDDLVELDKISRVGPVTMGTIAKAVEAQCGDITAEVIFSPQAYGDSHLARIVELIEGAETSLDIAMYNISDSKVNAALKLAVEDGIQVRFMSQNAKADRNDPEGSKSAKLENMGIDVRYVYKIMHHKFMIVDGPREDAAAAASTTLVTGSGNWSNGAATRYDENTVILKEVPELALRYQMEFNRLWNHSKDFVYNEALTFEEATELDPAVIEDDPSMHAIFTSHNFTVNEGSATFRLIPAKNAVADVLVDEILGADTSIHVASGHLRSRPISEALIAAKEANPDLDIKVYLDGQEYISKSGNDYQVSKLDDCLVEAGDSESQQRKCKDKGFLFSYQVSEAGIDLRFKYYAYRWEYTYAKQMHNKYIIIDGDTLITGSYNLSDNAEHNTFENMLVLRNSSFAGLIAKYADSFDTMMRTDEDRSIWDILIDDVSNADVIPLVFDSMALTWDEVTELKSLIADNCEQVNSYDYRKNPSQHKICPRD